MKTLILFAVTLLAGSAFAYQVTGPVVEVTDSKIIVQKGKEKWELAKDPTTKMNGDVKVGDKVTVEYKMTATDITAKPEKMKKK
jgi:hypothetical protein